MKLRERKRHLFLLRVERGDGLPLLMDPESERRVHVLPPLSKANGDVEAEPLRLAPLVLTLHHFFLPALLPFLHSFFPPTRSERGECVKGIVTDFKTTQLLIVWNFQLCNSYAYNL